MMELRNCSVKHFIQTIRGGLVIRVRNIDSHGRHATRVKSLKDVYASEIRVEQESPSFLVSVRSLRKVKAEPDEFAPSVDGDSDSDLDDATTTLSQLRNRVLTKKRKYASPDKNSKQDNARETAVEDESDLNEPLISLKPKHSKATRAKRRCLQPSVISSATIKVAIKSEENLVLEGSLQGSGELAPLVRVKVEAPDAEQFGSQNEMPSSVDYSEVLILSQSIVLHEYDREIEPLSNVNKYGECLTNYISYDHLEDAQPLSVLFPGDEVSTKLATLGSACKESLVDITKLKEIPDLCSSIASCSVDPNEDDHLEDAQPLSVLFPGVEVNTKLATLGSACKESLVDIMKLKEIPDLCSSVASCSVDPNEDDHLEDAQPLSVIFPGDEVSTKLATLGSACKESLVDIMKLKEIPESCSPIASCSVDPSEDACCHSSSSVVEELPEECNSDCQVPEMAIDGCMAPCQGSNSVLFENKSEAVLPDALNESMISPDENYDFNLVSITTSSTEENPISMKDNIDDEEQLSTSSLDTIMRNDMNVEGHTNDELMKALDNQNSAFPITCAENESSLEERASDNGDTVSTPEQHQLPERLFSTRKAFSPSSQERLCLAMNSVEIWNDSDINKCKGKHFENQTEKKPSFQRSEAQYDKRTVNHRLPGQVSQRKFVISPRRVIRRSRMAKGNLEGPRFSRTLPNLSTGCTSVQGCSESAVAFSQRQMHDMESIAVKLMDELKSMKDLVEQKMLFEAYRNVSFKNDADEVKSAINNATRAEEMAKKWMSVMARDSNRFCKIMTMMPDNTSPKDTVRRGKRKIMFADEAGGKLCHVRFFDGGTTSPASNVVEQ